MIYANPGSEGALVAFDKRYGNYIGGEFVDPVKGQYFENVTPVTGEVFCERCVRVRVLEETRRKVIADWRIQGEDLERVLRALDEELERAAQESSDG